MDVRKKFIVSISILIVIAIALSIVVYRIGTADLFEPDTGSPPVGSTPIDTDEVLGIPTLLPNQQAVEPPPSSEDTKKTTITIEDPKDPTVDITSPPSTTTNDTVTYTVRLRASWSEQLHPQWFPSGAHLSPMTTWSHGQRDIVFKVGSVASDGMEDMAETGSTEILKRELATLKDMGYIHDSAIGSVFDAPGENSVELEVKEDASLVTVTSMIAPSPDWFITAQNIQLFEEGQWLERKEVPALLFDAGTDSGTSFRDFNKDTSPAQPIALLAEAPQLPIAVFEFVRK